MKIVFVSNYLTHHQKPFSDIMYSLSDCEYYFVSTEPMEEERLKLGWGENETPDYVKKSYISDDAYKTCKNIINNADVVICGSAPDKLIEERLKNNKLTFKYSERLYKKSFYLRKYLRNAAAAWLHHGRFQKYPIYMLCASAYMAADCAKFGNYKNRCYKWGYFPETKIYENIDTLVKAKKRNSLLWAGRFLDWKHPDAVIRIAKNLKDDGYNFELNIIGTGPAEQELKKMISEYNLENEVHMLGSMKPEQVRKYMEQSQIYLFTSDRNEGWGAVLNESMNSACAVVASHEIGSVPFLLKDGENGFIYKDGDEEDLYRKVKMLLNNPDLCQQYGKQAYFTIVDEWNAETATKRFLNLSQAILNENIKPDLIFDGPCSKADILNDNWFKN